MSQFGMQMPAARGKRASGPDAFTALAFAACVFLIAAIAVVFVQGAKVGKGGSAFSLQDPKNIVLPDRGR